MFILALLLRRLAQGVVVVLLTTLLIFTLLRVVPGDPVRLIVGGMAPDNVVEEVAHKMGLRDPIIVQFGRYLGGLVRGDLGHSYQRPKSGAEAQGGAYNDPTRGEMASVSDLIMERMPLTLQLAGIALVFALLISLPLGIAGGRWPGRWPDTLAFAAGSVFVSLPNFWLGIVLALVVTVQLHWLPSIGYHGISYAILPAIVLAVEISPFLIRSLTVSVSAIMREPFIEAGVVRGLGPMRIVFAHALRNASVPLLNLLGIQLSTMLGGVLVVEYIFDYPGLGQLTVNAVLQRDFPLIQGIAIVTSGIFVLINIGVDVLAATIDPRLTE
ncbi:MAG TPA: ABC transporter permease [Stellaceae bacterium]|nr:ABC transporter permease [Stellaceae bacterium]